jgi:hypothetical protein
MAIGSWAKTPLYPGFSEVSKIIEAQMSAEKPTGQPREESSEGSGSEEELDELDSDEHFFAN